MQTAFLRGRDHQQIGRLELEGVGTAAAGLSRGGARKTYSHTDPNEDCVAFRLGDGGGLAVAADGHHGELGSEAAVECLLDGFASRWTARDAAASDAAGWKRQAVEALLEANRAILEVAARNQLPPAPTTFVASLVRPEEDLLLTLSVGDSHVFAVDQGVAIDLGGREPDWKFTPFLGYEQATQALIEQYTKIETRSLAGLDSIVLATDGLSEPGIGLPDPAGAVGAVTRRAQTEAPLDRRAVDTCRGVIEAALRAHRDHKAGDNMGCAVLWLGR